jgi:integrase
MSSSDSLLVPAADIERFDRAEKRREYAESAKAEGTWRVYDGHWKRFVAFCGRSGVSAGPPASPEIIADWIIELESEGKVAATIGVAVSAVVHRHRLASAPNPMLHPQLQEVLAGARRRAARRGGGRGPAAPLLPENLRSMVARLKGGLIGQRDLALLSFGLAGGFRREELCRLTVENLRFETTAVTVELAWSKTDQEGHGHRRRICEGDFLELCPVRNLRAWLAAAGITSGPIFRPVVGKSVLDRGISGRRVDQIVREYTRLAFPDGQRFSAHSLRAGLCTAAALAGKSESEIREHVDHGSAATTARYIRSAGRLSSALTKGIGL